MKALQGYDVTDKAEFIDGTKLKVSRVSSSSRNSEVYLIPFVRNVKKECQLFKDTQKTRWLTARRSELMSSEESENGDEILVTASMFIMFLDKHVMCNEE